jgi:four helix bundle protein
MATELEDLRILQMAEGIADEIWKVSLTWGSYARDVVGQQITRSVDSIGANIAEAYGRFHYGEKLKFLYYARGSLFETKYWLNRVTARGLMPTNDVKNYASQLSQLAYQLNIFAKSVKKQRATQNNQASQLREIPYSYSARISSSEFDDFIVDDVVPLFSNDEISYLTTIEPVGLESPSLSVSQSLPPEDL